MSQKINILELRAVGESGGGPEKTILLTAKKINREKFSTVVVHISRQGGQTLRVIAKDIGDDIEYIELQEKKKYDLRIIKQLRFIMKEYSINVIHGHDYKSDILGWIVSFFTRVKLVATAHGWVSASLRERFFNYLDINILRRFNKIIAINDPIAERLLRFGVKQKKIELIHNAIALEDYVRDPAMGNIREEFKIPSDTPVVGFVGRLIKEKDLAVLFMAAKMLQADYPELRVIIAGDGPLKAKYETYCKRMGIAGSVIFIGHRYDIQKVYRSMDIFVLTSRWEGIPNVILEAMAIGVPVISTNVGGVSEIITHNLDGLLIEPGDVNALCYSIKKLLVENELKKKIVENAYKKVKNYFSFSSRIKRIEELYEEVVGK